jgi:ribosomal protein S18 acetylase RimI-like enzyme
MRPSVLGEIEAYYDGVPRSAARVEQIGALTLFVNTGPGMAYYARPSLGATDFDPDEVQQVRARQRALGIPQAFEWVADTTPGMGAAISAAGLQFVQYPLMVLRQHNPPATPLADGLVVRLATLEDDFTLLGAVAPLAFGAPGTAVGPVGIADVRALAASAVPERVAFGRERVRRGQTVMGVGFADGLPVGVGVYQPVGQVTELAGIGVVPAFRRSGIGAAITSLLVSDALDRGIRTVFLSAGNASIARVYGRIGFERIGTACVAEPGSGH